MVAALMRLSLRTRRRAEDEADHSARMEVYLADLRAWPLEVALKAVDRWPERSEWWPTWRELIELIGEIQADRIAALPPPRRTPEHQPLPRSKVLDREMGQPFPNHREWDDFCDAMRRLRDPSIPMLARDVLLRLSEGIEARQLPHARAKGWA